MQLSSNELCDEVTLLAAVVVATREPRPASLDVRAAWLLPFVDGERTVEDLVAQSGLSHVDALLGIHELVARRLAELHLTAGTAL